MNIFLALAMSSMILIFTFPVKGAEADDGPFIVKYNSTGFTMPEWMRTEKCEVFLDHVVITKQYGEAKGVATVVLKRSQPLVLSGGVAALLLRSASEPLREKPNDLCDAPSTRVVAMPNRTNKSEIVLFSTGGCGASRQLREGAASDALRDIANTYCPVTFDHVK